MTYARPPIHDEASGLYHFRREPEGQARRLVVLLHGAGANAADLAGMEERYAARVHDAVWIRPDAPHGIADGRSALEVAALRQARPDADLEARRSWVDFSPGRNPGPPPGADPGTFDLETVIAASAQSVEEALEPAVEALNGLIEAELERLALDDAALALYGFSQGGMAALHTGLARPRSCAALVSHSGQFLGRSAITSTPPVLLLVGEKEMVEGHPGKVIFPFAARTLREADVEVEEYVARGLGHGSSRRSDIVISRFIERAFQERGR